MKEIYRKMNELAIKAKSMNNISKDEKLSFDKARTIKEQQDKVYKKFAFYQGFIKATNKKGSV